MSTRALAAVLNKVGEPLEISDVVLDEPRGDELLVRTDYVGLCHSDLHYLDGSLAIEAPAVLGHEVVGTVTEVGSTVTRFAEGDRVVATLTPACGLCAPCLRGRPTQCARVDELRRRPRPKMTTASGEPVSLLGGIGAFATAFLVGERGLAAVSAEVPGRVACLLGCCVTTGVGAVVHGAGISAADTVAVIGCGGVGMAAIQGARLVGARRIVAVDTSAEKRPLALRFGATDFIVADRDPTTTAARLLALVPAGFTHAVEAVGRKETAELAFDVLAPTGRATILGLLPEGERLSISADALVYGDRVLQGAYMGANRFLSDVEMFTDHYRTGRLDLDAMVTRLLPFEQINEGFEAMAEPTTIRVVLDMSGGRKEAAS